MKNVIKQQTVRLLALACVTVGGVGVRPALATFVRDPVTLDRTSTTVVAGTVTPSDILAVVTNPGVDPVVIQISGSNYGVINSIIGNNTTVDNTLDVSASKDSTYAPYSVPRTLVPNVHFTVDRASIGITESPLRTQIGLNEPSSSDIFTTTATKSPAEVMAGGTPAGGNGHVLTLNETFYGLKPGDNADSLELTNFKFSNDAGRRFGVYFTLDSESPSLIANGWATGDVLFSTADNANQGAVKFADSSALGLSATDVIDGLVVWDTDGIADLDNGADLALFSLAPNSPFLIDNGYSPADVFVTDFGARNTLYLDHTDLGLNRDDNIDGLDVTAVPEPTTAALLLVPAVAMLRRRSRRAV